MTEHYFTTRPATGHRLQEITIEMRGKVYNFKTDAGVFSKNEVDFGSRLLIDALPCKPGDTVLDLGCGYGPIGIVAANLIAPHGQVYLVDINERAVQLARENLEKNRLTNAQVFVSNGLEAVAGLKFDWVLSNPPIRAGKSTVYRLLAEAFQALHLGGCLLVVIRTKQGAKSLEKYLFDMANNCQTIHKKAGFRVLQCCKPLPA